MRLRLALILGLTALCAAGEARAGGGPAAMTVMPGTGTNPARGARPPQPAPFPPIADWKSLSIQLHRGACFGTCSVYDVTIAGDGTVTYDGRGFVVVEGRHVAHIAPDKVHALFEAFRKADFFHLYDRYEAPVTDLPAYTLSLSFDGRAMTVVDYAGGMIGMPKEVRDLEDLVDKAAGTASWVDGDANTMNLLRAEGWRFDGNRRENARLLQRAADSGPDALVADLLAAGVPVDEAGGAYSCRAAAQAAFRHRPAMLAALLAAGAPVYEKGAIPQSEADWKTEGACDVLLAAAKSGWPDTIALVLARHPDVNRVDDEDGPALMVLGIAADADATPPPDLEKSAGLLIAAGADVNVRDADGYTPLLLATDDAPVLRALLKAGVADIDAKGPDGRTALMAAKNGGIARQLLAAGADPRLRDPAGKTALDTAHDAGRADVEAVLRDWIAAHPVR